MINNQEKKLYCECCDQFILHYTFENHLKSNRHLTNQIIYDNTPNKQSYTDRRNRRKIHCEYCDVKLYSYNIAKHKKTKRHLANIKCFLKNTPYGEEEEKTSEIINEILTTKKNKIITNVPILKNEKKEAVICNLKDNLFNKYETKFSKLLDVLILYFTK